MTYTGVTYEIEWRFYALSASISKPSSAGADLRILRGGGGGSGPKFFKGGLGSKSAGISIY